MWRPRKLAGGRHPVRVAGRRLDRVTPPRPPRVLLLDTIGELSGLFPWRTWSSWAARWRTAAATTSWSRRFFGKPVITGPHMENFQAIADEFRAAGAHVEIAGPARTRRAPWSACCRRRREAREIGQRAAGLRASAARRHARAVDEVRERLPRRMPRYRPAHAVVCPGVAAARASGSWGGAPAAANADLRAPAQAGCCP